MSAGDGEARAAAAAAAPDRAEAPRGPDRPVQLVEQASDLERVATRLGAAPRLAFDLEANGLHAYRAEACVIQLATADEVVVVDALAVGASGLERHLGPLLGARGPLKIVHDVSFDARLLAEVGIELGHVRDTALTARFLGHASTGLGTLLAALLGVAVDKKLQHHDWGKRPFRPDTLTYLASDVVHLHALADSLWDRALALDIGTEIDEEVRHRLGEAIAGARATDARPPHVRIKGAAALDDVGLRILRRIAAAREELARRLDVPPFKVVGNDVLLAVAGRRPSSRDELGRIPGALSGSRARSLQGELLAAVAEVVATADGDGDERAQVAADRACFVPERLPGPVARARRARESRILGWRREEAQRRGVDEQVVLPGHCVKDLAAIEAGAGEVPWHEVAGLGDFRIARYGAVLTTLMRGKAEEA